MSWHLPPVAALFLITAAPAAAQGLPPSGVVAIESRTLTFVPSRDDVRTAWLNVHCSRPSEVRIDGRPPDDAWHRIALERVGRNRFALPAVTIAAPPGHAGLICLSIKVWFSEVDNRYDALLDERSDDRHALVSFATRAEGPDWERARPRFAQNRVATLRAFEEALARPFLIALNGRPLLELERMREDDERRQR